MHTGASFQHLLGLGSEPTPAECSLYSSEFQISALNLTKVAFDMSCWKFFSLGMSSIEDADKPT